MGLGKFSSPVPGHELDYLRLLLTAWSALSAVKSLLNTSNLLPGMDVFAAARSLYAVGCLRPTPTFDRKSNQKRSLFSSDRSRGEFSGQYLIQNCNRSSDG